MKKHCFIGGCFVLSCFISVAQNPPAGPTDTKPAYPIPEYSNEIYLVKKETDITLIRLEKGSSKQQMKVKAMGMGGMDQGYELEGEKSTVRLSTGSDLVFIFYTGGPSNSTSSENDSMMKANGMDPAMMQNPMGTMMDPVQNISLYSMKGEKGKRKVLLASMGIMGKSKNTSVKYTLSIKKIKDNYYELIVDKKLPKGEYTFVNMNMSMDQSFALFAFAVE